MTAPSFEERFAALRADWQAQLPARLGALRQLHRTCLAAPQDTPALEEFFRTVHSLAGSAGTFGLPGLSQQARELEHRIEPLLGQPGRTAADLGALQPGLDALLVQGGA